MKLLHISPYALHGGTEKDCFFFARDAREHQHHIWVLGTEGPMSKNWRQVASAVEHLDILKEPPHKFVRLLSKRLSGLYFDGVLYWSTLRLPLVRYALNRHTDKIAVHVGNPVKKSWKIGLRNMTFSLMWQSDVKIKLFACSKYVEDTLSNNPYLKRFDQTTSLNPVEIPSKNPYRNKILRASDDIQIGMVARLYPIKDHETVIRSFRIIANEYPNARLRLLGDGILKKKLLELSERLCLRGSVEFLGAKDNVYEFLNELDIFIYGTTAGEGLGNAVTEALANGLPCVISDLPMLREIAGNEETVAFCRPYDPNDMADKVMTLINDRKKRTELSAGAYQRAVEAFGTERYVLERIDFLKP